MSVRNTFEDVRVNGEVTSANASDLAIRHLTQDQDILLKINDGGTERTAIQVHGDQGNVSLPRQSGICATRTSAQAIATGTWVDVVFSTEYHDVLGEYNTGTGVFTAKDAGYYLITANISWDHPTANHNYHLRINVNGTHRFYIYDYPYNNWGFLARAVSGIYYLAAGQYAKIAVYQNSGGSLNLLAHYSQLSITKVA